MSEPSENIFNTYNIDMNTEQLSGLSFSELIGIIESQRREIDKMKSQSRATKQTAQCLGLNKRKEQCKRQVDPSVGYCFYHFKPTQSTTKQETEENEEDVEDEVNENEDVEDEKIEVYHIDDYSENLYEFPRGTKYYDDFV